MNSKIQKLIDESLEILNDEALFHRRDIPGDQDEFEPESSAPRSDPGMIKYEVYASIEKMIEIYDHLNESKISSEIESKLANVKKAIRELSMCMGKR
jgi:hypothetical protein